MAKAIMNNQQWNCRSIKANIPSFKKSISNNSYDIIVLSETWLNPNNNFYVKGFNFAQKCRNDGYVGVGILIRQDINFSELRVHLNTDYDNEVCAAGIDSVIMSVVSVYKPPNINVTRQDWIVPKLR